MVDFDELLPEEQANPDLLQDLRALYRMKPEEAQILSRARTRLAHNVQPLPLSKDGSRQEAERPLRLLTSSSAPVHPARVRPKWLKPLNGLAAILLIALLIGAFALMLSPVGRNTTGSAPTGSATTGNSVHFPLNFFLAATENGSVPSQAALDKTRALLEQRFNAFSARDFSIQQATRDGKIGFQIGAPNFDHELQALDTLLSPGMLEFWDTGGRPVLLGATLNPAQYAQYNPGGKARFTGQDLDPAFLSIEQDIAGRPQIDCRMRGAAIQRFYAYTTANINHYLTVTLDGQVIQSAVIQSPVNGQFAITGYFTQPKARAVVVDLKSGALPVLLSAV